jgi:SAM-dependent methyltransferase
MIGHLLRPYNSIYSDAYYHEHVAGPATESAAAMSKSIVQHFRPHKIIDVGCGTGALLDALRELGCEVQGLDYSAAGIAYCRKRGLQVRQFNIEKDAAPNDAFDLAISFEVAEHLPSWNANRYVDLLCSLAPMVVMSAATPGQGGIDHVNEQPHAYWISKFQRRNYSFDALTSKQFSDNWRSASAAPWYSDNVMIFDKQPIDKSGTIVT